MKHSKRYLYCAAALTVALFFLSAAALYSSENKESDPNQLFYTADHYYELREYQKALDGYLSILNSSLESGSLYYNIGNCYLKMGQLGRAILFYEKAEKLIPRDSDLKANLSYAISLVDSSSDAPTEMFIVKAIRSLFEAYSLRAVIFSATLLYLTVIAIMTVFTLKPIAGRRFRMILYAVIFIFLVNLSGVAVRYYDERIVRHGIVVQKDVECKYEPIDKSTTFYNLREGRRVVIINTRDGWRQVRRPDGKIGWVKKESIEEI